MKQLSEATSQDLFVVDELKWMGLLVQQAELLAAQYGAMVANPPYMGNKGMNVLVKKFVNDHFPDAKSDLSTCFIERGHTLVSNGGYSAMVTMQSWMFLASFEKMREQLLSEKTICSMVHLGARAFGSISGEVVQTTMFVLKNNTPLSHRPVFCRLLDGNEEEKRLSLANGEMRFNSTVQSNFKDIPCSPIAYWVGDRVRQIFKVNSSLSSAWYSDGPCKSGNDDLYLRNHWEVASSKIGTTSDWRFCSKGGSFRKHFGNVEHILKWREVDQKHYRTDKIARITSEKSQDLPGITWSIISSSMSKSFRLLESEALFNSVSPSIFPLSSDARLIDMLGFLNSAVADYLLGLMNPTLALNVGNVLALPVLRKDLRSDSYEECLKTAKADWSAYERSWSFQSLPLLRASTLDAPTLESSYSAWITQNRATIAEMQRLEEENNRLFIDAYGLADELTPDVPIEQITLTVNPAYRYGGKLSEAELWTRFREDSMQELVSYAVGCMMGRYSLDEPGLIYAHSGNQGFDPSRYTRFPADADGILPLTDKEWFADDAANRLIEFISVAWDKTHLEANLRFLADNLSPKKTESSRDTLRRYLCDNFFKDHLQTYKKRPIYWLFSSGKQKAFQCLVYLHRYNEGTLARMRTEYVIPLSAKLSSYAAKLEKDIEASNSTAEKKALEKQLSTLHNQQAELATFDEKLRHYADQRISLDLDDGVKVNYGKFGDLLAEVKTVTGGTSE